MPVSTVIARSTIANSIVASRGIACLIRILLLDRAHRATRCYLLKLRGFAVEHETAPLMGCNSCTTAVALMLRGDPFTPIVHQPRRTNANTHERFQKQTRNFAGISEHWRTSTMIVP